jgi:hypothetical protein
MGWNLVRREMAPQVGLEPTTLRLTVAARTEISTTIVCYRVEKLGIQNPSQCYGIIAFLTGVGTKSGTTITIEIHCKLASRYRLEPAM